MDSAPSIHIHSQQCEEGDNVAFDVTGGGFGNPTTDAGGAATVAATGLHRFSDSFSKISACMAKEGQVKNERFFPAVSHLVTKFI